MHLLNSVQFAIGVLTLACLSACSVPGRDTTPATYRLDIQDEPAQQRFKLVLTSQDSRTLCLADDAWPTGWASGDPMFVVSGDRSFSRAGNSLITRYCPGGCGQLQVPPKGRLEAVVPYEDFGEPQQIATLPDPQLQFSVYVSACRR